MDNFTFAYPTKVYFGEGAAKDNLPQELKEYGNTVLLQKADG